MGIVYVLSNMAMPGLIKIGMTEGDDANIRIGQLYTTGVPLPFELQYACRVENPGEVENALHIAFGPNRINMKREFFKVEVDQAVAILKLLNKPDATEEISNQPSDIDEVSLAAVTQAKARRPNLNFEQMGIPIGSILKSTINGEIKVIVTGPKKVKLNDEELSLTAATKQALGLDFAIRPVPVWTYNGKNLSDIYDDTYNTVE
jgi:hypothetical protein